MTFSFRPNGGTLRAVLTIGAVFLFALLASAQRRGTIDLAEEGLSFMLGKALVVDHYTAAEAQAKFPRAAQVCAARGYDLMQLSCFDAFWMQAVWDGQGGGQPVGGVLASQNHVIVPPGNYWQTVPAEFSGGEYTGAGPGYPENGSVNTTLTLWHERWQGNPAERHCLLAGTYQQSGIFSYIEGTQIRGFQLVGRSKEFDYIDFHSSGIVMWKPGEVTYTTDIFARDFRTYGIEMFAPTPHHIGTVSVFDNVVAGIGMVGSWGGTVNIDCVSGDDNGAMISSVPGYGQEGGGTINIGVVKYETGVASGANSERVWRGMVVGEFYGQFGVNIGAVSAAQGAIGVDALFIVDPRLQAGWVQGSMLKVGPMKGFTYNTLVHDLRGERFAAWPSFTYGDFTWTPSTFTSTPSVTKQAGYYTVRQDFNISGPVTNPVSDPYRHIVNGLPNTTQTVYLDELAGTTPTPQPPPVDPNPPPVDPEPVPPADGINPADVTVIVNSADPSSQAMAESYCAAWGIPTANVVSVNAGSGHEANSVQANSLRNAAQSAGREFTVLAMGKPSRIGAQSITSYVTFGPRNVSSLGANPLYGYTGTKPRTDKGVAPCWILLDADYIRRDAHRSNPQGSAYAVYANDQSGTPRGSARNGQEVNGVVVWDNTTGAAGRGNNPCNYLSNNCWIGSRKPINPVIAAYQSMYILGDDGGITWRKGFYGDHVTSFGGYIDGNSPNGRGQTPLTYHLDKGASFSVGSVSEPWQGGGGSLAVQFVDISTFHPAFLSGVPVGIAAWSAVQAPDRMLFAGDGMCAPF